MANSKNGSATKAARTATTTPVGRGKDEVSFLKSRQRTPVEEPRVARAKVNDLVRRVVDRDSTGALSAHDEGTQLIVLYMCHADHSLGFRSFRAFLEAHWPLDLSTAYERMRIARLVTREQAAEYGGAVCLLGLRIMEQLEVTSFEEFLKKPLRLHADEGGGTIRFPAPRAQLRSVLRALATPDPRVTNDDVGQKLQQMKAVVTALAESDPAIAALKPVVWGDQQDAYVRLTSTAGQAKAALKLFQRLAKLA